MNDRACLLCRIALGEFDVKALLESERSIAVLNTREPHAAGHVVVFPRRHVVALHDMDPADAADAIDIVRQIARAAGLTDYNVLHNVGAVAGQTVFHAHFHLIPKWSADEGLRYARDPVSGVDQRPWQRKITQALAGAPPAGEYTTG